MKKFNLFQRPAFKKLFVAVTFILTFVHQSTTAQTMPAKHGLGALFLTPAQYAALPRPDWALIRSYSTTTPRPNFDVSGITMLNNPPIGDQGGEGSCVGWAVGYSAMGVLSLPKFNCWPNAERSPNYIYNQIKQSPTDCAAGSFISDALNLIKNQGDCSWNLMPYIDGNCTTQPVANQIADAAQNKATNWAALNTNDLTGIKQSIDLGFPVVVGIPIYQSFYTMWSGNGIWSSNTGTYFGRHAVCVIGYDNIKQQLKLQNQWGATGGDHGCFWVPYSFVQNNCFNEVYIVYTAAAAVPIAITGPTTICPTGTYGLTFLPCNATVAWSSGYGVNIASPNNPGTQVTGSGNGSATLKAVITGAGTAPITITKAITFNLPTFTGDFNNAFDNSNHPLGYYPDITNPACAGYYITTNISISAGVSASWSKVSSSSVVNWTQSGNNIHFYLFGANQYVIFSLTVSNGCGSVTKQFKWLASNCGTGGGGGCKAFSVSPNPSNGLVNIVAPNIPPPCLINNSGSNLNPVSGLNTLHVAQINVYNLTGTQLKKFNFKDVKQTSIDLSDLINGSYYIETVSTTGYREKQLLVISKK